MKECKPLMLGSCHAMRKEHVLAVEWYPKGAEAGLPRAMFNLGNALDKGEGVAAPDHAAVAGWYKRAADGGNVAAAMNLCAMYMVGRGRAAPDYAWLVILHISDSRFLILKVSCDVASIVCPALGRHA